MQLKDQIEWEQECANRGSANYYERQDRLREKNRTEQTDAYQYVMRTRLLDVAKAIEEDVVSGRAGIQSKYNKLLDIAMERGLKSSVLAFLGLQVVIKAVAEGRKEDACKVTKICGSIGERIESELRCLEFERANPAYFDLIRKDLDENDIVNYTHKKKALMKKFIGSAQDFSWGTAAKVGVGAKILQHIEVVMSDVFFIEQVYEGRKLITLLRTKPAFDQWCAEFERERGLMEPAMLPLKIAPADWDESGAGGYYTHRMNMKFPFIKTKGRDHKEFVARFIPWQHIEAVNKIQKTAWVINKRLLSVVDTVFRHGLGWGIPSSLPLEIPPIPEYLTLVDKSQYDEAMWQDFKDWKQMAKHAYREEARRKGQVIQFMQTLKLARELADWPEFYYAYSCDFRGRVYCATTCLSPQSDGVARSLLLFRDKVRLGNSGISWLAVHGANQWGVKGSFETRMQWVKDNKQVIERIVENPIRATEWTQADEPYQFLAWCYEWADSGYGTNPDFESSLPVGIDGSCNGLQHFSAILRDPIGAKATNLEDSDVPQDIYQEVANYVTAKLLTNEDTVAELWLQVGVERGTTKRQCMTLPYGATQQSCRDYTYEWVKDNWEKFDLPKHMRWKIAAYLSPIIWEGIEKTVVAAVIAMNWLQANVKGRFCCWVSPVGFPVFQFYKKVKTERVDTRLAGKTKLTIHNMDKQGVPNSHKQKLGIVPNFIHSVDSSHMVMTINETNLTGYGMIHDEFKCHAGDMEQLYVATRVTFYKLHSRFHPLEMWAVQQGLPIDSVPKRGSFDIAKVLSSKYIFG
ncbi:RNA polymerase [Vibrio phage JSF7]|uniref:DNA-directed RNA polymerase n=1 Tax=Vibrio phage JSF7 TaxID=1292086 RepID=A0A240EWX2_9CAUD|nr:RNA polymerase [Vibrio phage JSF7]APD18165.1 RNA polymerase [Vibrio phage JSF7]